MTEEETQQLAAGITGGTGDRNPYCHMHDYATSRTIMLIVSSHGPRTFLAFASQRGTVRRVLTPSGTNVNVLHRGPGRGRGSERALDGASLFGCGSHGRISGGRCLCVGQGAVRSTEAQRESQ